MSRHNDRAWRIPALGVLTAVASICLTPVVCLGHGREPEVIDVAFAADAPERIRALTTFGLLRSDDDGASWDWICRETYDADPEETPAMALDRTGDPVIGTLAGLWRGDDAGCSWQQPSEALSDSIVVDVVGVPSDAGRLFAVRSAGLTAGGVVHASNDGGVTWTPEATLPDGTVLERLLVAPGDPQQMYITGLRPGATAGDPTRAVLFASTDGGTEWSATTLDLVEGEASLEIRAVAADDPSRIYLSSRMVEGDVDHEARLLVGTRASDGTVTVEERLRLPRIDAVAATPDGARLFVGGNRGAGLWRSDDGGANFSQLQSDLDVSCLEMHPSNQTLFLCGKPLRQDFGIARSDDLGVTLEPVFVRDDIVRREPCGIESAVATTCELAWFDLVADLDLDSSIAFPPEDDVSSDASDVADRADVADTDGPRDAISDAGGNDTSASIEPELEMDAPEGDGGCCTQVRHRPTSVPAVTLVALLLIGLGLRRTRPLSRRDRRSRIHSTRRRRSPRAPRHS